MTNIRGHLASAIALMAVWVMLWGRLSWANVVFGLVVAVAIQLLFPMPPLVSTLRLHPWGLVRLAARFGYDLVTASAHVAWLAVRPRPVGVGAIIDVPLRLRDDVRRTVVAELTSLVPGTVVIDLDPERSILTIHVLDITDVDLLRVECAKIHALEDRVERAMSVVAPECAEVGA